MMTKSSTIARHPAGVCEGRGCALVQRGEPLIDRLSFLKQSAAAIAAVAASFSLVCLHQGSTVEAQASRFYCPGHGATFSLAGQWTGGQRTSNLHSYPTAFDASSGTITVGG